MPILQAESFGHSSCDFLGLGGLIVFVCIMQYEYEKTADMSVVATLYGRL